MTARNNLSFFNILKDWLTSLPQDLKLLTEMMRDEQLTMYARTMAVGVVFYTLSPFDVIPDKIPIIGNIDDVIIIHIALYTIALTDAERVEYYRKQYPETFKLLPEQIQLIQETLGALYDWLKALVERLPQRFYQGKSTEEVIQSEDLQEDVFDETMEYAADVNIDPKAVENALLTTPPHILEEKLSVGLEEEQKRQLKQAQEQGEAGLTQRLTDATNNFRKLLGYRG